MGRPKKSEDERKSVPLMVRMPTQLLDRIDQYVQILAKKNPGINISRSDAIRTLVVQGLDVRPVSG